MKTFCFDLDGVICKTKEINIALLNQSKKVINMINQLYDNNKIIIFTARFMGRSNDRPNLAKKRV